MNKIGKNMPEYKETYQQLKDEEGKASNWNWAPFRLNR
jgi:hypothetical protein